MFNTIGKLTFATLLLSAFIASAGTSEARSDYFWNSDKSENKKERIVENSEHGNKVRKDRKPRDSRAENHMGGKKGHKFDPAKHRKRINNLPEDKKAKFLKRFGKSADDMSDDELKKAHREHKARKMSNLKKRVASASPEVKEKLQAIAKRKFDKRLGDLKPGELKKVVRAFKKQKRGANANNDRAAQARDKKGAAIKGRAMKARKAKSANTNEIFAGDDEDDFFSDDAVEKMTR